MKEEIDILVMLVVMALCEEHYFLKNLLFKGIKGLLYHSELNERAH